MDTDILAKQAMFEELFNTLLTLACEAYAGKGVLAFYAPDALIAYGGKVRRRAEVDETEYAWAFAEFETFGAEALGKDAVLRPVFSDAKCQKIAQTTEDRFVVWFACVETSTPGPVLVATGWKRHEGRPALTWMTVAESVADWTFEHGHMIATGDAAYIEGARFLTPRTWLDLGWYRVHGFRKPALNILPGARFACQSSSRCCRIGFKVTVPAHAQHVINSIPWENYAPHLKGTQLPTTDDGRLQLKAKNETCRFLDEQGHCRVHAAYGRAVFPVCATYPISFIDTPDGVDVSGSNTCGSFRRGLGPLLEDRHADLYARLALIPQASSTTNFFIDDVNESSTWQLYRQIEKELIARLMRDDLPLNERLWEGCLVFEKSGAPPALHYPKRPFAPSDAELSEWTGILNIWIDEFVGEHAHENAQRSHLLPAEEKHLGDLLMQVLFSKLVSGPFGLRAGHHANILLFYILRAAILKMAPQEGTLSSEAWWRISARIQHRQFLNKVFSAANLLEWARKTDLMSFLLTET